MTPEESRRDEAGRWLARARKDLNAAGLLATAEPSRSVFHSQHTPSCSVIWTLPANRTKRRRRQR